jgi:filamentous hemagglutinin family protein
MRTKQTLKRLRTVRRHRLALALVTAMAAPAAMAQATGGCADCLPRYGQVVSGSATSNYSASGVIRPGNGTAPTTMTITQTTRGAIIDWGTFNIANGYAVQFVVPDASGVTLNRVVGFIGPGYGVSSSLIDGGLTSNGSVFLVNPAGIAFGSGAVVNVGGLVASTLWMNSGDFLNGLSSGQYVFNGFNGDPATSHQVSNNGSITAGTGGVAFVGPTLSNGGSVTANGGTVGFAAGTAVTLDFVGDGLTQVTLTAPPSEDSIIVQDRGGSITADGGKILLRTAATGTGSGGAIYASGTLRAQSIANVNGRVELTSAGGPVMLGAPGRFSDAGSPFTSGAIDVTGEGGETGGTVLIQGNGVSLVNDDDTPLSPVDSLSTGSSINATGGLGGGQVTIQSSGGFTMFPLARINADGGSGPGGQVQVAAIGDILQWGDISAGSKGGNGGSIGIGSTNGDAAIIGTLSASGGGNGGNISLFAANGLLGIGSAVSANGIGGNGGQVLGIADTFLQGANSLISANGAGTGGQIGLAGSASFIAYGRMSARGGTAGGGITTYTGGDFDVQGLRVDAGASAGAAGTWTFIAPDITVVNGNDAGPVDGVIQLGNDLQDGEINTAFANGTNVTLRAGTTPADSGFLHFSTGVAIAHNGPMGLQFRADANGAISGNDFSIVSSGGPLSMAFNADAADVNNGFAGIDFDGATLASNGGDILLYGQSDLANGFASNYASGISLVDSSLASNGGNILLRGASTGADAGGGDAGVLLDGTSVDAGAGGVAIYGTGGGVTSGVILANSDVFAGIGGALVDGRSLAATGVRATGGVISANGGPISLTGIGGTQGVAFDGGLYSDGGTIDVHGEGGSGEGIDGAGPVDSGGGDITMVGSSASVIGLEFGSGANSGMLSAGGAISLTGTGVTGGVALRESTAPILLFGPGDVDRINSGGGALTVTGSASGAGATGVLVDGVSLVGGTGHVTVDGSAPLGIGVLFANGASATTTTGAITLLGLGADFGLDIADGAIDTDSGDLTLVGTALAASATAGVRVTGSGLATDGGDITVTGTSAGGVGVQLGGRGPFVLGSGGGDIAVTGSGVDAGVWMIGNTANSGGGDIDITGTASGGNTSNGVLLDATRLIGGAGDVTVQGTSALGTGIRFANGSGASTTSGAIQLSGTGANQGLVITGGTVTTQSGDLTLIGNALAGTATAGVLVTGGGLTTAGGDITITGTSAGGVGVQLGDGGAFAIGSGGGAIDITGTGVTAGVSMRGNTVTSGGGDIDVTGDASGGNGVGVDLSNARLIGSTGDVTVWGRAVAGTGVALAGQSGISTTSGAIGVTGIGANVGLALTGGELTTGSGHLDLRGRGTGASSDGLVIGPGTRIATAGGGIELSGEGVGGAGVAIGTGASVDAGNSLVVVRAGNNGSSDAIRIGGTITSGLGVNFRPGGVDANGGLTERVDDLIQVGGGTNGFGLTGAELALVSTPQLVIGSNLHRGGIQVLGGITRNGNLTLQNDGGNGGIAIGAGLNVGDNVLALSSGGSITQTSSGAITARSLLARAGGDVLLAAASNNVAANTLAGSAGGRFEYQDVDALAIGNVSAMGFDATANGLAGMSASGITAVGDVFVRNLAGNLTLGANVRGADIDLVTAGTLQNIVGASLIAGGEWRVWANTWVGENRGGLAGSGTLPNLYGCAYQGQCGVTVPATDNHFIYVQQPTALITFGNATREYGLPNPLLTFSVSGGILGDTGANVASGTATTTATIGSNVGNYPITGNFTSLAGYRIQLVPGNLAVTPATLLFTADNFVRYLGTANPLFTGTVTGFRNGDTVQSVFGNGVIWNSPAGLLSPIGFYPVNGGTTATNYVFAQAPGNATALQVIPLPQLSSTPIDLIRETVNTYVYDRNFGGAPVCAVNASLEDQQLVSAGDELSNEWSKVRSRPNLTNCFDTERRNSCGDF